MPEVVVENLTKRYGETTVLDDVGFAVGAGELFTLLGPSGCRSGARACRSPLWWWP